MARVGDLESFHPPLAGSLGAFAPDDDAVAVHIVGQLRQKMTPGATDHRKPPAKSPRFFHAPWRELIMAMPFNGSFLSTVPVISTSPRFCTDSFQADIQYHLLSRPDKHLPY